MLKPDHVTIEKCLTPARLQYERLEELMLDACDRAVDHGSIENLLKAEGFELLRLLFQAHLDIRSQSEEKLDCVIGSDGEKRRQRISNRCKTLGTIFGDVIVKRIKYGGKYKGIPGLHPMDISLNISPDKYSDGLRRLAVEESAKVSFQEASETIGRTTSGCVGKRQCEELTVKTAVDFEDFYQQRSCCEDDIENNDSLLVLSCDGKGISMHKEDLRDATKKKAEESRSRRLASRLSPGEKTGSKRMATVATVYNVAPHIRTPEEILGIANQAQDEKEDENCQPKKRPKIKNKRVFASVAHTSAEVVKQMFDEAEKRDPKHQRESVILVDGHEHQLNLVKEESAKRSMGSCIIVDLIHVIEYLWKAAHAFFPGNAVEEKAEAEVWVQERLQRLLEGNVLTVASGIRQSATKQGLEGNRRAAADSCANYLQKYAEYLKYDHYLEKGYPIATGVIEGACRHLVADRMAITGARWRLERAEAVLKIRSIRSSGDFEEYWAYHKSRELHRNHISCYDEESLPLAA